MLGRKCWELEIKMFKGKCMEAYREEKREVKSCIYQSKKGGK